MRLAQMQGHGGAAAHLLRRVFQSDQAPLDSGAGLSARLTEPDYSGQASRVTAATGLRPFGSTGLRAIDGERLALRILLVQYRRLRLSAADRAEASARFERKESVHPSARPPIHHLSSPPAPSPATGPSAPSRLWPHTIVRAGWHSPAISHRSPPDLHMSRVGR